jgi:outer membrane protein TolC
MSLSRTVQLCAVLAFAVSCRLAQAQSPATEFAIETPTLLQDVIPLAAETSASDSLFAGDRELSLPRLIQEVQSRNPTLQAMIAAWRSAAQRYPQAVALDDPMFMAMMAPASFGSSDVESAYVLEGSQKIPWFGKRAARGRVAQAEASAASEDAQATQLMLAEAAQLAFYDYYLVHRQQELNGRNIDVMRQFRRTAETKYRANQVTQRDVLQADVELTELERRQIELERMNVVAIARINTLLRRLPQAALPPPPGQLSTSAVVLDLETLQQIAIQQRPDVAALSARVRAEEAAVSVACKEYYPDGEFFGRYDSFWQPADTQSDLRGQVGVRLNVPIYKGRLNAAVREAMFRLSQRRAEYEQKVLDVRYEVQTAYAQLDESRKSLTLYSERLLPYAGQNVDAARANYDVGKDSFLDLALTQRQLIDVGEKREEALTTYHRRLAELSRAIGGVIPAASSEEGIPMPTQP